MTIKISIKNLHKSFGSKQVLKGIDLDIEKSQSLVVIGGSGTGKSVLLKNIIGLVKPDQGNILIDNIDINKLPEREYYKFIRKFGFLFQGGALFDSLPVWKNIAFGLIESGTNLKDARDIACNKLKSVGLEERVADLYPSELSGGMQKRVSLARTIAADPEVIFFDEPTTGLDPIMSNVINDLIVKCSEEIGATTITITHDMNSVRQIASKIAMLHKGKIIWQGNKSELDHTDNAHILQFTHGQITGPIEVNV